MIMIKWTWIDSGRISLLLKKAFELMCELIVGPSNPFMTFGFLLTSFEFWWGKAEKEQRNACMFPENTRWTGTILYTCVLVCVRENKRHVSFRKLGHTLLYTKKKFNRNQTFMGTHTAHTHTFRLSLILYSSLSRLRLAEF